MHKKLVKNMGIAAVVIAVSLAGAETSAYAANEIIGGEVMNPSVTSDKTEAEAKVKAAEKEVEEAKAEEEKAKEDVKKAEEDLSAAVEAAGEYGKTEAVEAYKEYKETEEKLNEKRAESESLMREIAELERKKHENSPNDNGTEEAEAQKNAAFHAFDEKRYDYEVKRLAFETYKSTHPNDTSSADFNRLKGEVDTARAEFEAKEADYKQAEERYKQLLEQYPEIKDIQKQLDKLQNKNYVLESEILELDGRKTIALNKLNLIGGYNIDIENKIKDILAKKEAKKNAEQALITATAKREEAHTKLETAKRDPEVQEAAVQVRTQAVRAAAREEAAERLIRRSSRQELKAAGAM